MVVDCVKTWNLPGKDIEELLDRVGITTSKSPVPDDTRPPYSPSGLRLGSPAMTTRGMKEADTEQLVSFMLQAIGKRGDEGALRKLHEEVKAFCRGFPVPGIAA
jgi:glycine hydroxymethyltransferase